VCKEGRVQKDISDISEDVKYTADTQTHQRIHNEYAGFQLQKQQ